uniref:NB-ARC domain-containing protein n=1 Tax=Oryza rufipogon TaxID=4529 RepID=A0A0E0Q933_ORYRU
MEEDPSRLAPQDPRVGLVVGGWIAKAVIANILSRVRSLLHDNFNLQKDTEKMLNDLEVALPRIEAVIEAAERRSIESSALSTWLQQLKDAVSHAGDVVDDFEAKTIKDQVESKSKVSAKAYSTVKALKALVFSDSELKKLKHAVRRLENVSTRVDSFIELVKLNDDDTVGRIGHSLHSETSSLLGDTKVIGRDEEISLILDIILGYRYHLPRTSEHARPDDQPEFGQRGTLFDKLRKIFLTGTAESSKSSDKAKLEELEPRKKGIKIEEVDPSKDCIEIGEYEPNQKGQTEILDYTSSDVHETSGSSRNLGILPIVGINGVGKTTVAQAVFNNTRVKMCFDLRAWVYVSDNISGKQIVQRIIMSLEPWSGVTDAALDLDSLQHKLIDIIRSKRLLLVLDGVSDDIIIVWSQLQSILRCSEPQSMVLVTTQKYSIANLVGTMGPITLNTLGQTDFRYLFEHLVFDDCFYHHYEVHLFESVCEKIADKFHGLPLAAKTVAPLLRANRNMGYWENVLRSDWWNIADHGLGINVLPALGIGCLNAALRQCLLFCSLFPRNYVFEKERVVQMWVAHGFIQSSNTGDILPENVVNNWFDELVDRSFLQPTVWQGHYVMHDLIREFSVAVSSNEYYVFHRNSKVLPQFANHISVDNDNFDLQWGHYDHKRLQTLMFFGHHRVDKNYDTLGSIVRKSTSLRVLDLSYICMSNVSQASYILSKLSHLRYLDLSFTGIKDLPEAFGNLYHLQVLDLRGCIIEKLPKNMNNLINLRHLYADSQTIALIYAVGQLTKLQELQEFRVRLEDGYKINELRDMKDLRKLCITNLEKVSSLQEAIDAKLVEKKSLDSLQLKWVYQMPESRSTSQLNKDILDGLHPHFQLKRLKILNYMGIDFPYWVQRLTDLIVSSHVSRNSLFGLSSITHINDQVYGTNDVIFPYLEELHFSELFSWEQWSEAEYKLLIPHLRKLGINACSKLSLLPIETLSSSVKELHLSSCTSYISMLPAYLKRLTSLTKLSIQDCSATLLIPCHSLTLLEHLQLESCFDVHFEGGMQYFTKLKKLEVHRCFDVTQNIYEQTSVVERYSLMGGLQSLIHLVIDDRFMYYRYYHMLNTLCSIRTMKFCSFDLSEFTTEDEEWLQQLQSLQEIQFASCRNLLRLPSNLNNMLNLKKVVLNDCCKLQSLPLNGLPDNLKEFHVSGGSEVLEQQCQKTDGDEWPKISHVPYVRINGRTIQMISHDLGMQTKLAPAQFCIAPLQK